MNEQNYNYQPTPNNQNSDNNQEANSTLPKTVRGIPPLNTLTPEQPPSPKKVRRQPNQYINRLRAGYANIQILIIVLTLATIIGMSIGTIIYLYTK